MVEEVKKTMEDVWKKADVPERGETSCAPRRKKKGEENTRENEGGDRRDSNLVQREDVVGALFATPGLPYRFFELHAHVPPLHFACSYLRFD